MIWVVIRRSIVIRRIEGKGSHDKEEVKRDMGVEFLDRLESDFLHCCILD